MKFARVRPGKTVSAFTAIAGIGLLFFGVFGLFPHSPLFGVIWCGVVLAMIIFYGINAFTEQGVATEEIEFESGSETISFDEKLTRLELLRDKKLISEREYQQKRRELMRQLV